MEDLRSQSLIDALAKRFYAAFDNTQVAPSAESVLQCFSDRALIVRYSGAAAEFYSVSEFVAPRIELLNGGGLVAFTEWETEARTEICGGLATRVSRYRKSGALHGQPYSGSGTKLFQLVRVESGWRIASLSWIDDDA